MSRKEKFAVAGGVLAIMLAAGVAFAAWTGTGTGSGRARAITAVTATVTPRDGTPDLYPGYTQGDVYFTISNPNPYQITFTDMTPGAVTVDAGHAAACPASSITVAAASGLSLVAAPGSSDQQIDNVVTMIAGAPDGCQGASFDIALTLTGTQS